jgi:hypothetical protein
MKPMCRHEFEFLNVHIMNENFMQPKISFFDIQLKASYMSLTWECVSEGMKKENSTERNNKNEG